MRCSICMATRNKADYLRRTLTSIRKQSPGFQYELIVTDDGSTDDTARVCEDFGVTRIWIDNDDYRNPSIARNAAYRRATGDVVICQSDDVTHESEDTIQKLTEDITPGEFLIAHVWYVRTNADGSTKILCAYSGPERPEPFFFLGSLSRKDLYANGGCDEEFTSPGYDDDWFGKCLTKGLGLKCRFLKVTGYHHEHSRPKNLEQLVAPSYELYQRKLKRGVFISSGGSWL